MFDTRHFSVSETEGRLLLGRESIGVDVATIAHGLAGKAVLVTGAAGSIGSELTRQILRCDPSRVVCVDTNETEMFFLESSLNNPTCSFQLADVGNVEDMRRLLNTHQVQTVFHAAAYKHVSSLEANPRAALQNNVFALRRLLDAAEVGGCSEFILISSDKAVNPTSVMGASKRIGELILLSRPVAAMRCITVRFGNVLGSRGSVLSIFQEQLAKRGQLSISHRDATRFFLTVLEATTLILQAVLLGRHRDLVVIEMGEPIRILDLARRFLRLRGIQEADVTFTIEELKPGEKLHEELFYSEEEKFPTACTNITRASGKALNAVTLDTELCELEKALFQLSDLELRTRIRRIVPQYTFHGFAEQQSNLEGALVPASCWSVA